VLKFPRVRLVAGSHYRRKLVQNIAPSRRSSSSENWKSITNSKDAIRPQKNAEDYRSRFNAGTLSSDCSINGWYNSELYHA